MSRDAGTLDTRILFQSKGESLNDLGEVNHSSLTDLFTVWGAVIEVKPIEVFLNGGDEAGHLTKFKIRYRTNVNEDNVISFDGKVYDIIGIEPTGANNRQWLLITARGV